jgi:hypothetical protein
MHLFGDAAEPHIAHFHAHRHRDAVEIEWEVRNAELRWRVLRSEEGFAVTADTPGKNGQRLLNETHDTFLTDRDIDTRTSYYYTIFSRESDGRWQRQIEAKLRPRAVLKWLHPQAEDVMEAEKSLHSTPIPASRRLEPRHLSRTDVEEWRLGTGKLHRLKPSNLGQRDVEQWLSIGGD